MNYLKLLKARRSSGKMPTIEQRQWSQQQQMRIDQSRCIQCGVHPAGPHSYLCDACQADDTIETVRSEIEALRHRLLDGR